MGLLGVRRSQVNWRALGLIGALWLLLEAGVIFGGVTPAFGASVDSASFATGTGTYQASGGPLYAKSGAKFKLNITTSSDTQCVIVTGDHSFKNSNPNRGVSNWSFDVTAGSGDGVKSVTITAYPDATRDGVCSGTTGVSTASYILDNTGPVVSAALTPAANAAGWNNSNVSIAWSAVDAGSGFKAGTLSPASDSVTATTAGTEKKASAQDNLAIAGTGSVLVKVDKHAPTITGSRTPAANAAGWNNSDVTVSFNCADATGTGIVASGIKTCPAAKVVSTDGASQSVAGEAIDVADNKASATVGNINVDKTAPTLTGTPTTQPNVNGWYNGDVAIQWACSDQTSGIAGTGACPAGQTITGEGSGLTTAASVSDKAGNTTGATSKAVDIDRKPPVTTATATGGDWNNVDVAVTLSRSDALSGVDVTKYTVNGGQTQNYDPQNKPSFSDTGVYTLEFWSVDRAGNAEAKKSIEVKIDKTPPTIGHALDPEANTAGWHKGDVTVTFECGDQGGSGLKSCTDPQKVTGEGASLGVTGTATDHAGNTATDPVTLSIDRTPPTITAAADRAANAEKWYRGDVTVSFTCDDRLSGVADCTKAKTLGEGANQEAAGTATDAAGNTATDKVTGINVDKSAPTISGKPTTEPNGNGWYSGDVSVAWSCADQAGLSGLAGSCPANSVIDGEGDKLSASAAIADNAGNAANATVTGIQIDRTAPSTSADVADPLASGWYAGAVEVTLNGVDPLSGVDKTYYQVDNGPEQVYTGKFNHSLGGTHTITYWSVDKAGNREDKTAPGHALTIKIDNVKPSITGSRNPGANGFGWNNGPVTVSFTCSDDESGNAGCTDPFTLVHEGAGQSVKGNAIDNAGNTAEATVKDINIDLTKPTLSGAATTAPNAADWYKGDVQIKWTADDGLSGIDAATLPANTTITGEGSNLGAGPVSVSDKAGNAQTASVSGIRIDRGAPTITPVLPAKPASGWYTSDVTVEYTCADPTLKDGSAGSGVANCPTEKVLFGNGGNQSTTSGSATDNAGNEAQGVTVGGINVDGLAPQSTANNDCDGNPTWCKGQTATVDITAKDQTGLSGVKEIRYSVNGGAEQTANGASTSVSVPLAAKSGVANVTYYAVDNAGNVEPKNGVALKYDNIAPTVTHSLTPPANAADWNNDTTVVKFQATDDDGGSGVNPATVTKDVTVSAETAGQKVDGSADDMAGNRGTDSVTVKLDKTAPTISGAATTGPNANGWYSGPVKVEFKCADNLSLVASCTDPVTLTADGGNHSVSGAAKDHAGNEANATVGGIKIDGSAPAIEVIGVTNGAIYTQGSVPTAGCKATDVGPSGLDAAGCKVNVTGGQANGVGTYTYTATAKDLAGNATTVGGSYTVRYPIVTYSTTFWLQPINDTAHTTGSTTSVFKAGSTVPAKFRLVDANGKAIQTNSPPQWISPQKGSPTTASVDENLYTDPATSGSAFTWNAAEQHYQFNWATPKNGAGYFWRIGVKLDDGTVQAVNIGLR